jgi:hypothetical protein
MKAVFGNGTASHSTDKLAVLKGHGFSRAVKRRKMNAA